MKELEHLKRSRRYRAYVHFSGEDPTEKDAQRAAVMVELNFTKGTGYDVTVRPIVRLHGGLWQTQLVDAKAVRVVVEHAGRFSERRLDALAAQLDPHVPELVRVREGTSDNAAVKAAILRAFVRAQATIESVDAPRPPLHQVAEQVGAQEARRDPERYGW